MAIEMVNTLKLPESFLRGVIRGSVLQPQQGDTWYVRSPDNMDALHAWTYQRSRFGALCFAHSLWDTSGESERFVSIVNEVLKPNEWMEYLYSDGYEVVPALDRGQEGLPTVIAFTSVQTTEAKPYDAVVIPVDKWNQLRDSVLVMLDYAPDVGDIRAAAGHREAASVLRQLFQGRG